MALLQALVGVLCFAIGIAPVFAADPDGQSGQVLARARAAYLAGRYTEAGNFYATAIERRRSAGEADELLARSLYEFGSLRKIEGHCEEASGLVLSGIQILEAAPQADPHELSQAWRVLGATYYCGHLHSKAEAAYRRALDLELHSAAPRKAAIFDCQSGLAAIFQNQGKLTRAEEAYQAARALEEDPQIDPRSRAFFFGNLGSLLRLERRYPESEATLHQGLAALGPDADRNGAVTAYLLNSLALVQMDRKDFRDAAGLLGKAVALAQEGAGVPPGDALPILRNYAICLRKTGHKGDAKTVESQIASLGVRVAPDPERSMVADVAQLARGK